MNKIFSYHKKKSKQKWFCSGQQKNILLPYFEIFIFSQLHFYIRILVKFLLLFMWYTNMPFFLHSLVNELFWFESFFLVYIIHKVKIMLDVLTFEYANFPLSQKYFFGIHYS